MTAVADYAETSNESGAGDRETIDEARRSGSLTGLVTTMIMVPTLPDRPTHQSVTITAIPSSWITHDDAEQLAEQEFGLQVLKEIKMVAHLAPGVATLIGYEEERTEEDMDDPYEFREQIRMELHDLVQIWEDLPSGDKIKLFSEYIIFGETALIEQSPPRRTSPAAVAATKISSRILTTGGAGTSITAVLAHSNTSPFIVIAGAGVTLLMSTAGAGLVLATHWLSKKLNV